MHGPVPRLAALAVCICLAAPGCAQTGSGFAAFSKKKTAEETLHIKTPTDRMNELRALAKAAKSKPPEEQQRIVAELSKEITQESDPPMRRQILRTLGAYPQPEAAAVLVAGLSDTDVETRRVACTSLGKHGGPEAVKELTRVVSSDTNHDVRLAAIRAMGQTQDRAALMPLVEAMGDADPAMQALAHHSLASVSGQDFGNDAKAWRDYASNGKEPEPSGIAERLKRMFR
jgi:HEAT repeat protein